MEMNVIDKHPSLKRVEERFGKTVAAMVSSFQIEGIEFSAEELETMVQDIKDDLKI